MTLDLKRLRELAGKATPGPWYSVHHGVSTEQDGFGRPRARENVCGVSCTTGKYESEERNRDYIAAANPQTILALLDRLEEVEARASEFDQLDKMHRNLVDEYNSLRRELEQVTRELKIAQLKNATSLANNLCPDHRDKQQGKPCLACEIERVTKERDKVWDEALESIYEACQTIRDEMHKAATECHAIQDYRSEADWHTRSFGVFTVMATARRLKRGGL